MEAGKIQLWALGSEAWTRLVRQDLLTAEGKREQERSQNKVVKKALHKSSQAECPSAPECTVFNGVFEVVQGRRASQC